MLVIEQPRTYNSSALESEYMFDALTNTNQNSDVFEGLIIFMQNYGLSFHFLYFYSGISMRYKIQQSRTKIHSASS